MNKDALRIAASTVLVPVLVACGGGGEAPGSVITRHEVLPASDVTVLAGASVPLRASAETFGPKLRAMVWSSAAATGDTAGSLGIDDAACAHGALSARDVPGSTGLSVGSGICETSARVPANAEGPFTISSTVMAARILVNVLPKPRVDYDFTLAARVDGHADGTVALNRPLRIVADVKFDKPIPAAAKLEYEWSFLVGGGNFTSGSGLALNGSEVTLVLPAQGLYVMLVKAKFTHGAEVRTKTATVTLNAEPASASSAQRQLDFTVSAATAQPEVFVGSPANLRASYTVSSAVATGKPSFKWSQLSGPRAALSNPALASVFVVPGEAGTLVFAVEVSMGKPDPGRSPCARMASGSGALADKRCWPGCFFLWRVRCLPDSNSAAARVAGSWSVPCWGWPSFRSPPRTC